MKLERCIYRVRDARFGPTTDLADGVLTINKEELAARLNAEGFFTSVEISIARPGEAVRIIHVMDAVEPRAKPVGSPYPGALGPMVVAGQGMTHVLDGLAILQTGTRQGIQEGVIDMSGPGAEYGVFSRTINVVLQCAPPPDAPSLAFDQAIRTSGLLAAQYLAEAARDLTPDSVETFTVDPRDVDPALPRVVYICHLQSQGVLRDTFVYGENVRALLPTILHPNEVLDGAIVSSNYIIACQKNPTWLHANNPVVRELCARHGRELNFAGVIIANEHSTLREKSRSARFAAKLAAQAGASGVVMTQEGGGHADTDLMLCCAECEKLGMQTVMLINEIAGPQGDQPSLVDTTPWATAVVSTGNNDEIVDLPPMPCVLGGDTIDGVGPAAAGFKTALGRIYTATNQFGATAMSAREQ